MVKSRVKQHQSAIGIVSNSKKLFPDFELQQVPDELERVMVGIQSYIRIRRRSQDISFKVFEADEGKSSSEKV